MTSPSERDERAGQAPDLTACSCGQLLYGTSATVCDACAAPDPTFTPERLFQPAPTIPPGQTTIDL